MGAGKRSHVPGSWTLLPLLFACNQPTVTAEPSASTGVQSPQAKTAAPSSTEAPGATQKGPTELTTAAEPEAAHPSSPASGGAPSTATPTGASGGAPSTASTPKKPSKVDNSQGHEVCKGEAREGCVPKDDPFGFVARE